MNTYGFFGCLCVIAGVLAVPACTQSVPVEPDERVEIPISLAPPISTVKPGAAISFSADVPEGLSVGNTHTVIISVNEGYPSGTLTLAASAKSGLTLIGETQVKQFDMANGTSHSWEVDIATEADGVHYVNVLATADPKVGIAQSRAHSVRVEVGDWKAAKAESQAAKPMELQSDGEMAVIMQAEETIE